MPDRPDVAGYGGVIRLPVWMLQTPPLKGAFCCGNERLVGVVAPNQPLAHAFRSQANQGPLLKRKSIVSLSELRLRIYEKYCK